MKYVALILMITTATVIGVFGQQEKCFENSGLKDEHEITFTINGRAVTGSFGVAEGYDGDNVKRHDFSGTISGSVITVKFPSGQPVDLPTKPASKTWTIIKSASGEKLRVTLYGKNYNTNKWSNYTADYTPCASTYDGAKIGAKRLSFAKGAHSTMFDVTFKTKGEKRSYWLGVKAKQAVSVSAPGCGISFFYPDKKPYEEGTAIDTWGSESVPQTGDYLFVISPAGEPGKCSVRFEAK